MEYATLVWSHGTVWFFFLLSLRFIDFAFETFIGPNWREYHACYIWVGPLIGKAPVIWQVMISNISKPFKTLQKIKKLDFSESYKIDVLKAYPFNDTKNVSRQNKLREQKGKTIHSNYFTATSISFTLHLWKRKGKQLAEIDKVQFKETEEAMARLGKQQPRLC